MDDAAGGALTRVPKSWGSFIRAARRLRRCARATTQRPSGCRAHLRGAQIAIFFFWLENAFAQRHAQLEGVDEAVAKALAASLQAAIADCLADRTKQAMHQFAANHGPSTLVIAGGVAANATIFARKLEKEALKADSRLSVPPGYLAVTMPQ